MEWLIAVLTIVFTPILTLIGIVITEKYKYRSKKMELDTEKNEAILKCQKQHKGDIEDVRGEFNTRLDTLCTKLDDIKAEQLRTALFISQLQNDVQKYNTVIEKTYNLEKDVEVLKARLGQFD